MKQITNTGLRVQTIKHWAAFVHARGDTDVARVHAFQAILREHADLTEVTDDQITEAYGGRGWAPVPACYECGARDDTNVLFGAKSDVSLCAACVSAAHALNTPPAAAPVRKSFFSRLTGA